MTAIFIITGFLVLICLAYPLWLMVVASDTVNEEETEEIPGISLVLLSCNGKEYLREKVNFLIEELAAFQHYELIIIDDCSTDGSAEELESFAGNNNIKIICKCCRKGIPDSMNMAVSLAEYEYIVFCDQRQKLSRQIIQRLVQPLKCHEVGAVSGCICHRDKHNGYSMIRRLENLIKRLESKAGSLIGVYGPLYAIKKGCYHEIPSYIILDDLYLSLRILKTKQIRLKEDCRIIDEDFSVLNDYNRAKRYISGFLQLLNEKSLIDDLELRHKIMLVWHKYMRLFVPFFLFLSYICSFILSFKGIIFAMTFSLLTIIGIISFVPGRFRLKNLVRINILYFVALWDVFINDILLNKKTVVSTIMKLPEPGNAESGIQ